MKTLLPVALPVVGSVAVAVFLVLLPAQSCHGGKLSTDSPDFGPVPMIQNVGYESGESSSAENSLVKDKFIQQLQKRKKRSTDQNHEQTYTKITSSRAAGRRSKRGVYIYKRWKDGVVPYIISDEIMNNEEWKLAMLSATEFISNHTCIRFVPLDPNTTAPFYLRFVKLNGCLSYVGPVTLSTGGQTISCCPWACIHELGHAVGLFHEMRNNDDYLKQILRRDWFKVKAAHMFFYRELRPTEGNYTKYDRSSPMHYKLFSTGELSALMPGVPIKNKPHYFFKLISELYNCKASRCSSFSMTCQNSGFVTEVKGRCACSCPDGLDPDNACKTTRTKIETDIFPGGEYVLQAPEEGCPSSDFEKIVLHQEEQPAISFCKKNFQHDSGVLWPRGRYCIYRVWTCPLWFEEKQVKVVNAAVGIDLNAHLPFFNGAESGNVTFYYCCRNDGLNVGVDFPNKNPLALPMYGYSCTSINGMGVQAKYHSMKGSLASQDYSPDADLRITKDGPDLRFYYCHYYPRSSCGYVTNLSESHRSEVIQFSSNSTNPSDCYWLISGPEGSSLVMKFLEFSVNCIDELDVNFDRVGQPGDNYCGTEMSPFRSIGNVIELRLKTVFHSEGSHFKAIVSLITPQDTCFDRGIQGSVYRGHVSKTRDGFQCLPWNAVTHCKHHAYAPLDWEKHLDNNYCRNPGDGFGPWCYYDGNGCKRNYCDVCGYESPSQTMDTSAVQCNDPPPPPDAHATTTLQNSYRPGDTVTYRCNDNSNLSRVVTCLSDGSWSPIGYVCGGCRPGWTYYREYCYKVATQHTVFYEVALRTCNDLGGDMAEARDYDTAKLLTQLTNDGLDMWNGLRNKSSVFTWQDGTEPMNSTSLWDPRDKNTGPCTCLAPSSTPYWKKKPCFLGNPIYGLGFVCRRPPEKHVVCADLITNCNQMIADDPFVCKNQTDFASVVCRKTCGNCLTDVDHCASDPCQNGGTCVDHISNYTCNCPTRFQGSNCQTDIDHCASDPCQNGGTCVDHISNYTCNCPTRFQGSNCQNIDHCASDPCQNGGTCVDHISNYTCNCPTRFQGSNCQKNIDHCASDPCQNGGTCVDHISNYTCNCPTRFQGSNCQNIDHCASDPCQNGGTCVDHISNYTCNCPTRFQGSNCQNIDHCASDPCQNGGTCVDHISNYTCNCPTRFQGSNCQTYIDHCASDPCQNGGTCVDHISNYTCNCPTRFQGSNCQNIDHCASDPCQNGGTCVDHISNYTCNCPTRFQGSNCQNIDHCASDPCQNGGTCVDHISNYTCNCPTRFQGSNCQKNIDHCASDPCQNGGTCVDHISNYTCNCPTRFQGSNCQNIDHCASDPCQNGGTCVDHISNYTCNCPIRFQGSNCQNIDHCASDPCQNGGTCVDHISNYTCNCPTRFQGSNCQNVDLCASHPCQNGGTCVDHISNYACNCLTGFKGSNCQNIDHCASDPCQNGGTSVDHISNYTCNCPTRFQGSNCQTYIDHCASDPCQNGGTCVDHISNYTCNCPTRFQGSNCQNIDHCASDPCQNGGTCVDHISNYTCNCPTRFQGSNCQNVDLCASHPCQNGGTCVDHISNYACNCLTGFKGSNCQNVDHCASDPCQNGGTCVDHIGNYTCNCPTGFQGSKCQTECRTAHFANIKKGQLKPLPDSFKPKVIRVNYTNVKKLTVIFQSESKTKSVKVPTKKGCGTMYIRLTNMYHDMTKMKVNFAKIKDKMKKSESRVDIDVEEDGCAPKYCESTWSHVLKSCYKVFVSDKKNYENDTEKFCKSKNWELVVRKRVSKQLRKKLAKLKAYHICSENKTRSVSHQKCRNGQTKKRKIFTCKRPTM